MTAGPGGGVRGYGGGEDILQFAAITLEQLAAFRPADSNDLWLGSWLISPTA
jgi:hypothetical protein